MQPIRLGILGCGAICRAHLRSIAHLDALRPHAYADVRREAAEALRAQHGGAYATNDPEQLMADRDLDALFICTHHDTHKTLALQALAAGKHVFLEKPVAMNLEDARQLVRAADAADRLLFVGYKLRFAPLVLKARRLLPNPYLVVGQMVCPRWAETQWAQHPEKGGGNVLSQGCHMADLITFLKGSEPVAITATGGTLNHDDALVDTLCASIRFADGGCASWIQADAGDTPFTSKLFVELFDGSRSLTFHDRLHQFILAEPGQAPALHRAADEGPTAEMDPEGMLQEVAAFADCIQTGRPPAVTIRDGFRSLAMVFAAFEALRTGRETPIATV
jgi:predicted dehydrogenase